MRMQLGDMFRSFGVALAMCGMLMLPATIVGCAERDNGFLDQQPGTGTGTGIGTDPVHDPVHDPATDPTVPRDTPATGTGEPVDTTGTDFDDTTYDDTETDVN